MTETTYNGWANRETWAVNVWVDELGLTEARDATVRQFSEDTTSAEIETTTREWFEAELESMQDLSESSDDYGNLIRALSDIGSLWRVDWLQLGQAWLDDVEL